MSKPEKRIFFALLLIFIFSGGGLLIRNYLRFTVSAPAVGGGYREGLLREPRFINPIYASSDADRDLTQLVFSSLLSYSGGGTLELDMAESYEVSGDGKVYLVKLKNNLRWHDGQPVSPDDIVFTIKTIQNPLYKSPSRPNWQGVEVEKIGEDKVRFALKAPYAPFTENLTLKIIPKHLWEQIPPEQAVLHEMNLKPIGSGPFKFKTLKQNKDGTLALYELERNPKYHKPGPYLNTFSFSFYRTENELLAALRRGEIDGFGPLTVEKESELARDGVSILKLIMPRQFGIFFNQTKSPPLADIKVREAMASAISKEEIALLIVSSGAIPRDSILPAREASDAPENHYAYSPETGIKILENAGWTDQNRDGFREKVITQKNKKSETVPLRFTLTTPDLPELVKAASFIQESLKTIGIQIIVEKHPFADLDTRVIRPRNFEMLLFGQVYGHEPDPFSFWHSSQIKDPGLNISGYANKKADKLLEEARKISSASAREKIYEEFEEIVLQDIPALFLYSQQYAYVLPKDLRGVELSAISLPSDRLSGADGWYKSTRRAFRWW